PGGAGGEQILGGVRLGREVATQERQDRPDLRGVSAGDGVIVAAVAAVAARKVLVRPRGVQTGGGRLNGLQRHPPATHGRLVPAGGVSPVPLLDAVVGQVDGRRFAGHEDGHTIAVPAVPAVRVAARDGGHGASIRCGVTVLVLNAVVHLGH